MTREEFEKLAEQYDLRLFKDAKKHGAGDDDTAREMVQETLADLSRTFSSFRGESNPYTWFHAVLRHKIRDRIAQKMKDRRERAIARSYARPHKGLEADTTKAEEVSPEENPLLESLACEPQSEKEDRSLDVVEALAQRSDRSKEHEDAEMQAEDAEADEEFDEEVSDDSHARHRRRLKEILYEIPSKWTDPLGLSGSCRVYNPSYELVKVLHALPGRDKEAETRERVVKGIMNLFPADHFPNQFRTLCKREAQEALQRAMEKIRIPQDIQSAMWRYAEGIPLSELATELDLPPDILDYEVRKWFPRLRELLSPMEA